MSRKILVVDDDPVTRDLLREFLSANGFEVYLASNSPEAIKLAHNERVSLVLSDIRMGDFDGLNLLTQLKEKDSNLVMIMMTGFGSMEGTIEAIQKGAFDYISKPFDLNQLLALVTKASRHLESKKTDRVPEQKSQIESPRTLVGKSPRIVEVYKTLARATLSTSTVLITGESGTGKELVARAVHDNSSRKSKRFVAINCGALTETLLESELFGYKKGSFTGAIADKTGLFEEASGGTLFLDEIGDITLGLQVKLLRAIQEGEIRPVGSNQTIKVDVRIIAATHRDLEKWVKEGKFREDLYYRLKVIEINLPALRDRKEDIPDLVNVFVKRYSIKQGKAIEGVSEGAMKAILDFDWPGNVRQLEHQIERAIAMTSTTELGVDDFDFVNTVSHVETSASSVKTYLQSQGSSLEVLEKEHILRVLKETDYNKSKASEILGIDRATLYRKAQKYGIKLKLDE